MCLMLDVCFLPHGSVLTWGPKSVLSDTFNTLNVTDQQQLSHLLIPPAADLLHDSVI